IRKELFDHIQRLSLKYYSNTKTGEIISRVIHDVEQTKHFVITGLMNVWLDLVTIAIAVIIMLTMDVWLTIVVIILFPLYGFAVKDSCVTCRRLNRERLHANAETLDNLQERIHRIPVSWSLALARYADEQFYKRNTNSLALPIDHSRSHAHTCSVTNTIC